MIKSFKAVLITAVITLALFYGFQAQAADYDSTAAKVKTESTALNIRSAPSASSKKTASAKKDSYLTLMKKEGAWWKVEYTKGKYGYVHSDYIVEIRNSAAMTVSTQGGMLNVRTGKSTSNKIKATLAKGTVVVLLKDYGEWSRILYDGNKTGHVKSSYLTKETDYKRIALDVPSYKQTDPRWSEIRIGTQGDTIYSSGCTTTALAMTESFRLKQNVTPKDMVSRLSYAPSGILYWPGHYDVKLIGTGYLSEIYSFLEKGKPVVFGLKTAGSSQHWVVVTGHTKNTDRLSAENFTVNDPGSKSRTLLSEVMAKYPNPYKIAVAK